MSDLIRAIPDIQGCYLVTPTGTLGRYQPDGRFAADPEITAALAAPAAQFLAELRKTADTRWARLGIVHPGTMGRPWKSATLVFADDTLRKLYPTAAQRDGRLTRFQLQHREHSLFRGLELLLDYRDPAIPDIPYFCPVLMYRRTVLADYSPLLDRPAGDADRGIPAVELVDLLAGLARSQRQAPGVAQLVAAERTALLKPERRTAPSLGVLDRVPDAATALAPPRPAADTRPAPAVSSRYTGDDDRQVIGELVARYAASEFRDWSYDTSFKEESPAESRERFGRYLDSAGGYRFRSADDIRRFERFEHADSRALAIIAAKSPVFIVPAGAQLLMVDTRDRWNLYLLSGEVELAAPEGARYPIVAGSPSARLPVAFLKPRVGSVFARTEVEFLWLYEPMIEAVLRLYSAGSASHSA